MTAKRVLSAKTLPPNEGLENSFRTVAQAD
jgi:hypothetical protein